MTNKILTPYAASQLANAYLQSVGLPTIRPQMVYNYTYQRINKGLRPLIKATRETGVDRTDLERWVKEYAAKKKGLLPDLLEEVEGQLALDI